MSNNISKKTTETEFEYIIRVCSNKDFLNLSWNEIKEILNTELCYNYSQDRYRKIYYKYLDNSVEELKDSKSSNIQNLIELQKEKVKIRDERTQINALIRRTAREETIKELAMSIAKEFDNKLLLKSPDKIDITNEVVEKHGILCLSDWHYGIEVNNIFNCYNVDIAKDRVISLKNKVIDIIKKEKLKEITIVNLGDLIAGKIHLQLRINSQIDVITQIIEVSEILTQFIYELTKKVKINYTSVIDNHSRLDPNKKEALQLESLARITDWYIKDRLKDNLNFTYLDCSNSYGEDISVFSIFDFTLAAVHGDKDKQKTILNKLCAFTQLHLDAVLSAHMHHFSVDESNETELFCNGSLMGTDDYAHELRLNSNPSHTLLVATPDNISSVIYKIKL